MKSRYALAGVLAAGILLADQITKFMAQSALPLWHSRPVIAGFFSFTHVVNRGAAFGFLNRMDIVWQRGFFITVTLLALAVIGVLLHRATNRDRLLVVGLGCILGGALGNLVDRVRLGLVVDFLDFQVAGHHWPAFNLADTGICVGAGLLLLSLYGKKKHAPDSR